MCPRRQTATVMEIGVIEERIPALPWNKPQLRKRAKVFSAPRKQLNIRDAAGVIQTQTESQPC